MNISTIEQMVEIARSAYEFETYVDEDLNPIKLMERYKRSGLAWEDFKHTYAKEILNFFTELEARLKINRGEQ